MSGDADLRRLERAHRADPSDLAVGQRYVTALRRAGDADTACRVQFRLGERIAACATLGIRWEADDPPELELFWQERLIRPPVLQTMVAEDLAHFDPVRLLASWPRTLDGTIKKNTTLYLRRYRANEHLQPYRRLVLIAWSPGTASTYYLDRKAEKGKRLIVVGLEIRSTRSKLLPPSKWRS